MIYVQMPLTKKQLFLRKAMEMRISIKISWEYVWLCVVVTYFDIVPYNFQNPD